MICPESVYILKENFIYFTRMPVLEDIEEECTELWECCRQLLANRESKHTLCDGMEEAYGVGGGLSINLEKCPHPGCGARFYASPGQNLQHQDSIHCGVLGYICVACRGIYVLEGALMHHIIHGHNGPEGFKKDMDIRHGERYCTKVSYTF